MARMAGPLAVCLLLASGAYASPEAEGEEEDRIPRELAPDVQAELDLFALERPAVFVLSTEGASLDIRATPDGLVQFVKTAALVNVRVRGAEGNSVSLKIRPGEQASVWPIERLIVRGGTREFTVKAYAAGWAFVVRADKVGRKGTKLLCDGLACTLFRGQRVDTDRKDSKVVFRVTGQSYPGRILTAEEPKKDDGVPDRPIAPGPGPLREATPGVLLTSARDFPWQSVALPVLSWEVFRPSDVSP